MPDGGPAPSAAAPTADGTEVTGPSAPLALVLHHSVDSAKRAITLRCAVHNRTLEVIKGVEVRCAALRYAVLAVPAMPAVLAALWFAWCRRPTMYGTPNLRARVPVSTAHRTHPYPLHFSTPPLNRWS